MTHLYPEKYHLSTNDVILGEKWGWSGCEVWLECGSAPLEGHPRSYQLTQ